VLLFLLNVSRLDNYLYFRFVSEVTRQYKLYSDITLVEMGL